MNGFALILISGYRRDSKPCISKQIPSLVRPDSSIIVDHGVPSQYYTHPCEAVSFRGADSVSWILSIPSRGSTRGVGYQLSLFGGSESPGTKRPRFLLRARRQAGEAEERLLLPARKLIPREKGDNSRRKKKEKRKIRALAVDSHSEQRLASCSGSFFLFLERCKRTIAINGSKKDNKLITFRTPMANFHLSPRAREGTSPLSAVRGVGVN